jgi:hypothetical protein
MADEEPRRSAPYLAWRTFFNLILQMEEKGLPSRMDRSYLSNKSGIDQSYLLAALRSFGLILEDGSATPKLIGLVKDKENRAANVASLLREGYPEVLALPHNATQQQLDDVFRQTFGLNGATLRKAETFFLHAARYGDIKVSPHFRAPRGASAGPGPSRRPRLRRQPAATPPSPPMAVQSGDPDELRRQQYFELLLKKAETAEGDDLLNRIERLLSVAPTDKEPGGTPSSDA